MVFKNLLLFFTTIIFSTILYLILILIYIFPWTPDKIIISQQPEKSELIIILEGEYYIRIDQAIYLAKNEYSNTIYYPGISLKKNKLYLKTQINKYKNINFIYDSNTRSTYEEALKTKQYIKRSSINKIILVTSPYHSYRAWWIFSKVLPNIRIISVPVPEEKNWFLLKKVKYDAFHKKIVLREQIKFLFYFISYSWQIY